MKTVTTSICENCDSEFTLSFNINLVKEHDEIFCPFCTSPIDSIEEEIPEDEDFYPQQDDMYQLW